ncbi:pentapeptide repeat-containing protein [Flavobacterium sp.]|uniref:pentapeptide repeat-containing protein n=1 Tax=Flavobacterium sp. TaxID=239 RepID=UPI002609B466|nr:pentapeptide repeat-containing protein [Flavobacterium sp.]
MKKNILFLVLLAFLSSCSVEKLIEQNNQISKTISQQNDTIIYRLKKVVENDNNIYYNEGTPNLKNLKRISFKEFYYGDIINEKITDKKGEWIKVDLTERVYTSENVFFVRGRSGWLSFKNPENVYLTNNEASTKSIDSNENFEFKVQKMAANDFTAQDKNTTKPDLMDQKLVDELLAHNALNFDGLKFDNKRFDYANFSSGSFRGTYFLNSNLSNITATSGGLTNSFDFTNTKIEGGTNTFWNLNKWKLKNFIIFNTSLENCNFTNCTFFSDASGMVNLNNVTIKNSNFDFTADGYFKLNGIRKTTFEGCTFTESKTYGSVGFEVKYIACNFNKGFWNGVSFNNTQAPTSKIIGGSFSDFKIIGGDWSYIKIEPYGIKTNFSKTEFVSVLLNNATIEGWFKENFKMYGFGNYSSINFTTSIFENGTFGSATQTNKTNFKNCNFTGCEFRENVKFINCDLTGSTFPPGLPITMFDNCIGVNL